MARAGPLSLLGASLLAIPAGVLAGRWEVSLAVLALQVLLGLIGSIAPGAGPAPPGRVSGVLLRVLPGVVGALSVAWSTWLLGARDLEAAFTAGLRVLIIVLPSALFIRHIDADSLGDHLGQRLRLPARVVVALAAALQRVQTFGETWSQLTQVRRVRGIGARAHSPRSVLSELWAVTFGILVRSLHQAAELAVAMDSRGFASASRRTWAAPAPWTRADWMVLAAGFLPLLPIVILA